MALYLVQHGKSLPKDIDPQQGLSEEGRAEAERIASVAKGYRVKVSGIVHSGKKRALQTAEIFASALDVQDRLEERSGLKPLDDVAAFAATVRSKDNLMLVGHLPFMERMTSYLTTGSIENLVFKFQNGGILCLDEDVQTKTWYVKWTLMPHIG
jgi:phosphohistidine phosphatase